MHLHILGICGTFMGSSGHSRQRTGHRVTGSDANVYPPMSDQLAARGIALHQGYDPVRSMPGPIWW
jgi:UDP-N-acetylmuramate: L-alanyl-gamma-D-glutamyl-meso-diaminopimelate ligase